MQSFTCSTLLGIPRSPLRLRALDCHGLWLFFPEHYARFRSPPVEVPLPRKNKFFRFGLFRFRSPLLTESFHFLFLGLLRCFTSPRIASADYTFTCR